MRRQTVKVNDKGIDLTTHEYRLLEHFMIHAGRTLNRTELSERLYDEEMDRDSNIIDVYVNRLRKKLDPTEELKPFETLRGRGYRFAVPRTKSE